MLGYAVPWSWTGFTGDTLWNWLHLLLLPLLLPTLVVPALTPILTREVVYLDRDGHPIDPAASPGVPAPTPFAGAPSAARPIGFDAEDRDV